MGPLDPGVHVPVAFLAVGGAAWGWQFSHSMSLFLIGVLVPCADVENRDLLQEGLCDEGRRPHLPSLPLWDQERVCRGTFFTCS